MTRINEELEMLSRKIVDQHDVDWARVSLHARTKAAGTIQGLQMLDEIIHGFRHAQIGGDAKPEQRRRSLFAFAGLDVLESLGRGASGEVYVAYDPILDLKVALKLRHAQSESLAHQFIAEARRQARVRNPHVASVFGAALDGNRVGIWMEHVRGESLAVRMQRGAILHEEIVSIGMDLCAALQAVHQHGLVHGDVKAENVICETGGRVVLADFGCARELDAEHAGGVVACTLRDTAPEVLKGGRRSASSDIFALGVLLYRLISGRYPFRGDSAADLLAEQAAAPASLSSPGTKTPRALCRIVERCLSADPNLRPSSARELARALGSALEPRSAWRGNAPVLAIAAGVLVAITTAVVLTSERVGVLPWHNELALFRVVDGRSAPLKSGERVAAGDGLQVVYLSNRDTWLYVLDDDGSGKAAVLFPAPGLSPSNPVAHDAKITLPRASNEQLSWIVGDDNPREEILVIASSVPQPSLDRLLADWIRPSHAPEQDESARSATSLRRAPRPDALDSARLQAAIEQTKRAGADNVQYWRFELPHDRP